MCLREDRACSCCLWDQKTVSRGLCDGPDLSSLSFLTFPCDSLTFLSAWFLLCSPLLPCPSTTAGKMDISLCGRSGDRGSERGESAALMSTERKAGEKPLPPPSPPRFPVAPHSPLLFHSLQVLVRLLLGLPSSHPLKDMEPCEQSLNSCLHSTPQERCLWGLMWTGGWYGGECRKAQGGGWKILGFAV